VHSSQRLIFALSILFFLISSYFRYRCVTAYPPNSDHELELYVGDIVYVHKKRDDGWLKGTSQRTGRSGLFPSIFVEPI